MNKYPPLDRLFAEARQHQPGGEAGDFGFATRLRAALAVVAAEPTFAELVARFSWRFSAACLPVALALTIFLSIQYHYSLPEGVGGLLAQWMELLPLGT